MLPERAPVTGGVGQAGTAPCQAVPAMASNVVGGMLICHDYPAVTTNKVKNNYNQQKALYTESAPHKGTSPGHQPSSRVVNQVATTSPPDCSITPAPGGAWVKGMLHNDTKGDIGHCEQPISQPERADPVRPYQGAPGQEAHALQAVHGHPSGTECTVPKYAHIKDHPLPDQCLPHQIRHTYGRVVKTGLPNPIGARQPVKSSLNIQRWQDEATGHEADNYVLEGVQYSLQLQYGGPPLKDSIDRPPNHSSAREYPVHIQEYIDKETREGALVGPLPRPPFKPWCVFSPMMSRPKDNGAKRRIIVDLLSPKEELTSTYPKTLSMEVRLATHSQP